MIGSPCLRRGGAIPLLLLGLCSAAPPLAAQGRIEQEIAFVRALAREMRFIGLAQTEVARLEQQFRGAGDQDRIAQLGIEVSLYGARSKADRVQQRTDYKQALERSKELLDRSSDAAVQREARATLANASQEFGQFLIEELEIARTDNPDAVKELEEEAANVFRAGIEASEKVMQDLVSTKAGDEQKQLEYGLNWLRKGVLQREHGRAVKADRDHLVDRARSTLEEMVIDTGEETALGLRGLFEIAQCDEVGGKLKDAIDGYRSTIDQIKLTLDEAGEGKLSLSTEAASLLFDMMQEVYAHLGELLFEHGDSEGAAKLFASFRQNLATFGQQGLDPLEVCDPRFGHLTFLAECRFLAESGDREKVQQALEFAQKINDKHPSDYVGIRAKQVISGILAAQAQLASGALMIEVAKGDYQNKDYEAAVKGFRRALAAMTPAEQKELALVAYDYLGKAYRLSDRYIEAVLAFRRGLQEFGADNDKAGDVADNLDKTVAALKTVTKNDAALQPLFSDCEAVVLRFAVGGQGKIHWKNGNDRFAERKFAEAAAAYAQVPADFLWYELSRARLAKSQVGAQDFAAARKTVQDYRTWLQQKEAVLDPKRQDLAQVRQMTVQEMDYTEASMAYVEAYGDKTLGLEKTLEKYPRAIELMRAFIANHGKSGESSVVSAIDALGRLHADLGELDKAEESYVQLKEKDVIRGARLATVIFAAYLAQIQDLVKELDAAASGGKDTAAVEQSLKTARTRLCALGLDYMRSSQQPQLGILVNTMVAFEKLGDWKKVDEVAQRALQLYADDTNADVKQVIDLTVRPKIGEALLQQKQFQQALDMLQAAEKANPTQWELKRLICQALGGWFFISDTGRGTKELALGRAKEAYDKFYTEYRQWAERPEVQKFSLEWYRFHWEAYWFARQAGEKDSTYKEYADSLFRKARATDDFATLKSLGNDGMTLFKYFDLNR